VVRRRDVHRRHGTVNAARLHLAAADRARWTTIGSSDNARYVPSTQDLGHRLRVIVAASNEDGTTASTSTATAPVGAGSIARPSTSRRAAHKRNRR
jgi:hypothetical protein